MPLSSGWFFVKSWHRSMISVPLCHPESLFRLDDRNPGICAELQNGNSSGSGSPNLLINGEFFWQRLTNEILWEILIVIFKY